MCFFSKSGKKYHKTTATELFYTILISSIPFVIGVIAYVLAQIPDGKNFTGAVYSVASNGEFIIYSASLVVPVFNWLLRDTKTRKYFPYRRPQILFWVLLMISIAVYSVMYRMDCFVGTKLLDKDMVVVFSVLLLACSFGSIYVSSFFYYEMEDKDPIFEMKNSENSILNKMK